MHLSLFNQVRIGHAGFMYDQARLITVEANNNHMKNDKQLSITDSSSLDAVLLPPSPSWLSSTQ